MRGASLLLAVFACCLASPQAQALSSDHEQPIEIESDGAELDEVRRVTVYTGNVVLTQGSIRMTGDRLTLNFDANNDLRHAVLKGAPARFRQTPDDRGPDRRARASEMEYYTMENRLLLRTEAVVWQGEDTFKGNTIEYDTLRHVVKARKGKAASDRVRITIQPRN